MSRQRSEIVGIPSWGLASLTSFFQMGKDWMRNRGAWLTKLSQHSNCQGQGEHQAGRLPLAMSSPQEFTGTAVTASGLVSIVSFVVVILVSLRRYVNIFWSVSLV